MRLCDVAEKSKMIRIKIYSLCLVLVYGPAMRDLFFAQHYLKYKPASPKRKLPMLFYKTT